MSSGAGVKRIAQFDPPSILFTIINYIPILSIMWEGGGGTDEFRVRDEEQTIKAKKSGTDPAAALSVIKRFDLAHGTVETDPLAGYDAAELRFRTIPVLSDVRHIIYNTRRCGV
jgi:hypothetical protein